MLDLTALEARFRNLSLLDAKPPGKRCFYSNLRNGGMEKTLAWTGTVAQPEGQGLQELLMDIWGLAGCCDGYLYNQQSTIRKLTIY